MLEYHGYVNNVFEAFILAEAAHRGLISEQVQRPSAIKLKEIDSGTNIVFNQTMTGMTRWIDGRTWSPSRFKDGFFVYRELVPKSSDGTPYYTGLCKRVISILSPRQHHIHLISYYHENHEPQLTLNNFLLNLPDYQDILNKADDYRYYKCFRTSSGSWRQPCAAPGIKDLYLMKSHSLPAVTESINDVVLVPLNLPCSNPDRRSSISSHPSESNPTNHLIYPVTTLPPISNLFNLAQNSISDWNNQSEDQRLIMLLSTNL